MKEKSPLDEILKEIAKLLEFAQSHAGQTPKIEDEKAIFEKLDQLEQAMADYQFRMISTFYDQGITSEELAEGQYKIPSGLSAKEKETWRKATQMWWDAEGMKYALQQALKKVKQEEERPTKTETSEEKRKAIKTRLEKFKRLGGKKHWKPL